MKTIHVGENNDLYLHAVEADGRYYPLSESDLAFEQPDATIYYDSGIYPGTTLEQLPQYICDKATNLRQAAAVLGRAGGSVTSAAKAAAARANTAARSPRRWNGSNSLASAWPI